MSNIIRVEDLLHIPQLTTGALFYASQSGTPYNTTLSDVINAGIFTLPSQLSSLSGYSNNTFATINNLLLTGQRNYNLIIGLSGALNQSGTNVQNQITNINNSLTIISGGIGVTGINGITGGVTLVGQGGVTIVRNGQTINISGSSSGSSIIPSQSFTTNIDWSLTNTFYTSLSGNTAFTFTNTGDAKTIVVSVSNPTPASNYTLSWPSGVKWPDNTVPLPSSGFLSYILISGTSLALLTQTGTTDVYTFIDINNKIYGNVVQRFPI